MKTDRFSDSIRRKLESIRPDFNEKDWAKMQATLLKNPITPPSGSPTAFQPIAHSMWSAQPWLMAAAVSTVVLVGVAIWQQKQISQLRHTVSELRQSPATATRPDQTSRETTAPNAGIRPTDPQTARRTETQPGSPAQPESADRSQATASRNGVSPNRPDTVYITRYVPVPAKPTPTAQERTAQRSTNNDTSELWVADRADRTERADRAPLVAGAQPQKKQSSQPEVSRPSNDPGAPTNVSPDADGNVAVATTTNGARNDPGNRSEATNASTRRENDRTALQPAGSSERTAATRKRRSSSAKSITDLTGNEAPESVAAGQTTTKDAAGEPASQQSGQSASYAPVTSQPFTVDTKDWSKALAHRARQMRPARTTIVGGAPAAEPASQPVQQVALGFRVGAGMEVSRNILSGSILTELLIGKHLTLGVGLGKSSFAGGNFLTDKQFDQDKRQDFRHNYARGLDPRNDIINIGIRTACIQLPISLGYRIPISQSLSLVPSVGTTLHLQSTEYITFFYRRSFQGFEEVHSDRPRPVDLFNNLTFGAGIEWKRKHWVGQAGPLVTVPVLADANWQQTPSVGLRARVFYQF